MEDINEQYQRRISELEQRNTEIDDETKEMMKQQIYCEIVEKVVKQVEKGKEQTQVKDEGLMERIKRLENKIDILKDENRIHNNDNKKLIDDNLNQMKEDLNKKIDTVDKSANENNEKRIQDLDKMKKEMAQFSSEFVKKNDISITLKKEYEEYNRQMKKKYNINADLKQLETWTNFNCDEIIFDPTKHGWSKQNNEFRKNILNKSKICIVIENTDGEIFGCYINSIIDNIWQYITDYHAFIFNLESNGRYKTPMKFDIEKNKRGLAFYLYSNLSEYLFVCRNVDILAFKENIIPKTCLWKKEQNFEIKTI